MKLDYYLPPDLYRSSPQMAERAVRLGYDGFFTAETAHDPFLPIAMGAAHQTGLDWGTAIAVAFARSPMVTAMTARDLAAVTEGRFLLGLGTQVKAHITRRFSMAWSSPAARLEDYIGALRAIWGAWNDQSRLNFRGDYYQFTLMTPFFDPGPSEHPSVPIYIAGVGPGLARLAGKAGDGFHVHPFHTAAYLDDVVIPSIAAGAAMTGRHPDDVELVSTVFVVTGRDEAEIEVSRVATARQIAFYASTPSYRPVLEAHGWDIGPTLTRMSKRGQWTDMAGVITDDILQEIAVVAPLDEVGERLRSRYGTRLGRIGFYSLGEELDLTDNEWADLVETTRGPGP